MTQKKKNTPNRMHSNMAPPKTNVGDDRILVFAKKLASNNKTIRDRSVKKLRSWLQLKSKKTDALSEEDLLKIWKGIHFSFWMTAEPLIQEEMASVLSKLIHAIDDKGVAFAFIDAFFATQAREWPTIDTFRLDKFMMLIRFYLRESLVFLKRHNWDEDCVLKMLQVFGKTVMDCNLDSVPVGLKLHFIDIYLDELTKIGHDELNEEQILVFLKPYCVQASKVESVTQLKRIMKRIFEEIIQQTENRLLEEQGDSENKENTEEESEETTEEEAERSPMLNFDLKGLADCLFELASGKSCLKRNRKTIYKAVTKLRDAANGVFHDNTDEVSDDDVDYLRSVDKAASNLLKLQSDFTSEQAKKKRTKKTKRKLEQDSDEEEEPEKKRKEATAAAKKSKNKYKDAEKKGKGKKKKVPKGKEDSDNDTECVAMEIDAEDDILAASSADDPSSPVVHKPSRSKKTKQSKNNPPSVQESRKEFDEVPFDDINSEGTDAKSGEQKAPNVNADVLISDSENGVPMVTTKAVPSVVEISSPSDVVLQNGSDSSPFAKPSSKKKKKRQSKTKTEGTQRDTSPEKAIILDWSSTQSNTPPNSTDAEKSTPKKKKKRKESTSEDGVVNNTSPGLQQEVELWIPNKKYTGKYKDWFAEKAAASSTDDDSKENAQRERRKSAPASSFATFEPVKTPPAAFVKKVMLKVKAKSEVKTKTQSKTKEETRSSEQRRVSFGLHKNSAQTTKDIHTGGENSHGLADVLIVPSGSSSPSHSVSNSRETDETSSQCVYRCDSATTSESLPSLNESFTVPTLSRTEMESPRESKPISKVFSEKEKVTHNSHSKNSKLMMDLNKARDLLSKSVFNFDSDSGSGSDRKRGRTVNKTGSACEFDSESSLDCTTLLSHSLFERKTSGERKSSASKLRMDDNNSSSSDCESEPQLFRRVRPVRKCRRKVSYHEEGDSDDCVIVDVIRSAQAPRRTHVNPHNLLTEDSDVLVLGEWLSDIHINLAQALLKQQYIRCDGLENCGLGNGKQQYFTPAVGKFIQLFNTGGNHWITLTNLCCPETKVRVYDSLYRTVRSDTKAALFKILAKTLPRNAEALTIIMPAVQKQPNSSDCGVFAIAMATSLLERKDPAKLEFETKQMRSHLKHCFDVQEMTQFPCRKLPAHQKSRRLPARSIKVPIPANFKSLS